MLIKPLSRATHLRRVRFRQYRPWQIPLPSFCRQFFHIAFEQFSFFVKSGFHKLKKSLFNSHLRLLKWVKLLREISSMRKIAESTVGGGENAPFGTVLIYVGVPYAFTERERILSFLLSYYRKVAGIRRATSFWIKNTSVHGCTFAVKNFCSSAPVISVRDICNHFVLFAFGKHFDISKCSASHSYNQTCPWRFLLQIFPATPV